MREKAYTGKDTTWRDHKGIEVPFTRTSKRERLTERQAFALLKEAKEMEARLRAFKEHVLKVHEEVVSAYEHETGVDTSKTKGNKQWNNFDKSILVECSVQERIEFDAMLITSAREKLSEFLRDAVKSEVEFVQELVAKAFETTNGKLDAKKVMGLLGFKHKIKAAKFQEAMELIERSIQRTDSKSYFRIHEQQPDGSYKAVELNFSAL